MNAGIRQYVQSAFQRDGDKIVALVSPRRDLLDSLKSAVRQEKRFQLVTIQGNLSQMQPDFGAGLRPVLLVADLHGDLDGSIANIDKLRKGGFDGAIIIMSETLDEASLRGMLRFHVADWLPADAEDADIIEACARALNGKRTGQGANRAQCLAFVPAAGGVGTTTLAIQAAYLLANRTRDFARTCLVDLNLQSGCLADYLDLEPLFDVDAIRGEPGRLDGRLLEMMLARHGTGLCRLGIRAGADRACAGRRQDRDHRAERRLRYVSAHGPRLPARVAGLDVRRACGVRSNLCRHPVYRAGHAQGEGTERRDCCRTSAVREILR